MNIFQTVGAILRGEKPRKDVLAEAVARRFLELKPHHKYDVMVADPELYFAVARLARHLEGTWDG